MVNENGHPFTQAHLKMLLVCHMASLVSKSLGRMRIDHLGVREQEKRITLPLNPDMMDMIMGGEEVGDLDPEGPVHTLKGAEVPDMMNVDMLESFLWQICLSAAVSAGTATEQVWMKKSDIVVGFPCLFNASSKTLKLA